MDTGRCVKGGQVKVVGWKVNKRRWAEGGKGRWVEGGHGKGDKRWTHFGNVGGLFSSLLAEGLEDCELPIPFYVKLYCKFCETRVSVPIQESEPVFGS